MGTSITKTDRVGEKVLQKNGMTAEIIEYHRSSNITVRFEDGKIVSHVSYYNFVNGNINYNKSNEVLQAHSYHVGEKVVCHNEMIATIIAYRSFDDIDIEFDDGIVVEHVTYLSFNQHSFQHPDYPAAHWPVSKPNEKYIGRKKRTLDGYRELVAVHDEMKVDYIDDNGELIQNAYYHEFLGKNTMLKKWRRRGVVTECIY